MLSELAPDEGTRSAAAAAAPARSAWWLRVVAHVPLRVLYGCAGFLAWLAYRVFPYRAGLVPAKGRIPELDGLRGRVVLLVILAIRLAIRTTPPGVLPAPFPSRLRALEPGARADVAIEISVPEQPGRYALKFDMVSEGVDWFEATEEHRTSDANVRLVDFLAPQPQLV